MSQGMKKWMEFQVKRRRGGGAVTTIVAIVLIAGLAWFAKGYLGGGSDASQAQVAPAPQAPAVVTYTVERAELSIGREYVGRVEPVQTVAIRPQVAGEIATVHFTEGSAVKAGDLLFTLDSQQYQATVELRKADLAKAQANYDYAVKYYNRLKASDARSVSAADMESAENSVNQNKATIAQANASLKLAQIDLGYTKITAPINGQIGRAAFTKGNYVTPAGPELASVVQMDPIRVAFSMPDRDYLGRIDAFKSSAESVYETSITLPDGRVYPYGGARDFEDNVMDTRTGTITIRLRFQNDKGTLVPGTMVKVMTKPASHIATVVPQEAAMGDAQGDFVYVVTSQDVIERRAVAFGEEAGYMSEVLSGLEPGERIVVRGLQAVRPGMTVSSSPMHAEGEEVTPAEQAMASGYDLKAVSADTAPAQPEGEREGTQ